MLSSALAADFVTEGRSLILAGKPGRGKTHLAIAIAYRAIQNGFDAYFTTAAALIDDLSAAFRAGELAQPLGRRGVLVESTGTRWGITTSITITERAARPRKVAPPIGPGWPGLWR
jgi:hypothetical protein